MVYISVHCKKRIVERIRQAGLDVSDIEIEMNDVLRDTYDKTKSYAVKVKDLGIFIGDDESNHYDRDESNGEVLWLIIRNNYVCTFFFRRRDQPTEARKFSVDEIR